MPISSKIFSVDTLQIRPVEEAFKSGDLVMPVNPSQVSDMITLPWGSYTINYVLVIVATILLILYIRRIFTIFPYLFKGIGRCKELEKLEESMRLIRERNSLVFPMILPLGLLVSKYGLYEPQFLSITSNLGLQTLIIIGVILAFILFRHIMIIIMSKYKLSGDSYQSANRIGNDFFILSVLLNLLTIGILSFFNLGVDMVKTVLFYEISILYFIFIIRRLQILSKLCNQFTSILYLCTLEILPASLLVASEIFL